MSDELNGACSRGIPTWQLLLPIILATALIVGFDWMTGGKIIGLF